VIDSSLISTLKIIDQKLKTTEVRARLQADRREAEEIFLHNKKIIANHKLRLYTKQMLHFFFAAAESLFRFAEATKPDGEPKLQPYFIIKTFFGDAIF
jgi:hypothetical protein